jgi:hypothetical protein
MRTFTDLPFLGLDTITIVPKGKVLEAAVNPSGLYTSPLVVFCPANARPYQEALTV